MFFLNVHYRLLHTIQTKVSFNTFFVDIIEDGVSSINTE